MLKVADMFAGGGGFTTAASQLGLDVVWAGNHDRTACHWHAKNHPKTQHVCKDLREYDFCTLPDIDVLLASPCCQGFSKARGKDNPAHDASRATCFAVVDCMIAKQPPVICIENVTDIREWGPRGKWDGSHYKAWLGFFEREGYIISEHEVNAADCGVPQERRRLFITMVHESVSNSPIVVPKANQPHAPVFDILEWHISHPMNAIADKCPETQRKIAVAKRKLGVDTFMFSYYGSTETGRTLDRPLGTVTTVDRWALVMGDRLRMITPNEARCAMGFPDDYLLPHKPKRAAMKMLGNAVCPPAARHVITHAVSKLRCKLAA